MGANRFSECPKCAASGPLALDEDTESGNVETLREDWELGADDGDLVIDYRASCGVCKLETHIGRSITFFDTRTHEWKGDRIMTDTEMRDNGPFLDADQAHAQFAAATHGLPGVRSGSSLGSQLVMGEALMMTGALPSGYESDEMVRVCVDLPPETVQVIAGWVIRAWLAGRDSVESGPADTPRDQGDLH